MPRRKKIAPILLTYLCFLCSCFLVFFCLQIRSIGSVDGILTGTITSCQIKSNEEELQTFLDLKNWSLTITYRVVSYPGYSWCLRGVMVKAKDSRIVVSEFELQSFTFGQIPLGKV